MFNLFKKKQTEPAPVIPGSSGPLLIITATTNFGLVVSPQTKEPLMFTMLPTEDVTMCVQRNAPFITESIDVSTCLVVQLAAHLPNQAQTAANQIFALVLPEPGVLLNHDMVLIGYEELGKMPGPTSSMLQMLVKQMPQEYFAQPTIPADHKNVAPSATEAMMVPEQPATTVAEPVAVAAPAPVMPTEPAQQAPAEPVGAPVEQPVQPQAPENTGQVS